MAQPKLQLDGVILSIMHSGTWFTRQLLKDHGFGNVPTAHYPEETTAGVVITPVRHPDAVYGSWKARGKPVGHLRALVAEMTCRHGILLPVDSPRRDEYLAALSDALGVELSTDWRKLHTRDSKPVHSGLFDDFRDFYGPIYG